MRLFKHGGFSRPGQHYKIPKRWGYVEISEPGKPPYLKRWYLWRCKWFSVRIHHFLGPDPDQDLHDHPWNFISLWIAGGYEEMTPTGLKRVRLFSHHRATDLHKILTLGRSKGVWRLFVTGREQRSWGFSTPTGWQPYAEYLGLNS